MILSLLALEVAPAPASTDNPTVILWVVAVMAAIIVAGWAYLAGKIKKNEEKCDTAAKKCEEDRKEYRETISGYHRKVETIYQKIIEDKEEASRTKAQMLIENARVLEQTQHALDRNTAVFDKINRASP